MAGVLSVLEKLGYSNYLASKEIIYLTESLKHFFADRAHFLGDPDFVNVPLKNILNPERMSDH